ncbi:MAG: type I glyceraldehyde-3-phosphate dehydrogenase [Candidatus Paceibacterota bacterium]|jgi:glyceraldehyde 3-phosphate dehydrogenase
MRIAINGFGRIGRLFFRQAFSNPDFEIVAINDLGDVKNLAYLLKYDSVYRTWDEDIKSDPSKGLLIVGGKSINFYQEKDPTKLPWGALHVDVVIESTGVFESYEKARVHLDAGAKRVLLTAPAKDDDGDIGKTVLIGLNENKLSTCKISSNASCTTNAVSPVMAVLSENPGIEKAILSTVHAYTATQSIVDGPVKGDDYRRGRAAAQNIAPSTTGAATAVGKAMPELLGKFDGIALRVPTVSGSLVDLTFISKIRTTADDINRILIAASKEPKWQGILGVTEEQLVSSDIIGMNYASLVDLKFTKVIDGNLVKVLAWYDNEWGYVTTLIKHLLKIKEVL